MQNAATELKCKTIVNTADFRPTDWEMVGSDNEETCKSKRIAKPAKILYLALVFDATGSMGQYIEAVKRAMKDIVKKLCQEEQQVFVGVVAYRDHPPQDSSWITTYVDFTENVAMIHKFLDETRAQGGGDGPEAVEAGLLACLDDLTWDFDTEHKNCDVQRVAVLIADAPPHGLGEYGDGFPNGAPTGVDPLDIISQMSQKEITVHTVGCQPTISQYRYAVDFMVQLAKMGNGEAISLDRASDLPQIIMGSTIETTQLNRIRDEIKVKIQSLRIADPSLSEETVQDTAYRSLSANCMSYYKLEAPRLVSKNEALFEDGKTMKLSKMREILTSKGKYSSELSLLSPSLSYGGTDTPLPEYRSLSGVGKSEALPEYRSLSGVGTSKALPEYRSLSSAGDGEPLLSGVNPLSSPKIEQPVSIKRATLDRSLFDRLARKESTP